MMSLGILRPVADLPRVALLVAAVISLGVLGGVAAHRVPGLASAAGLGLSVVFAAGLAALAGSRLRVIYLSLLALSLAGYAFFGRTFSYVGSPPVFVGEIVLLLGVLVTALQGDVRRVIRSEIFLVIGLFVAWGALTTVPHLSEYGIDALRDAVIWGYAAFAIIVAACLRSDQLEPLIHRYGQWSVLLPSWVPCLFLLNRIGGDFPPQLPWAEVSLWEFKPGDLAVHLAGLAAFLLLVPGRTQQSRIPTPVIWIAWTVALVLVASISRGALLSVLATLGCVALLGSSAARVRLTRLMLIGVSLALVVGLLAASGGDARETERRVSLRQLSANVASLAGSAAYGNLDDTKAWRLDWWNEIVSYTLTGPYFWQGKGFGVNLADDDGFQVTTYPPLRSPHSIHMSVLARTGVPGLLLWAGVLAGFAGSMVVGCWRARAAGQEMWARVHAWVLGYWVASLVNASFDVYLEGPAGGIWFWCQIGFGVAVLEAARRARALGSTVRVGDAPQSVWRETGTALR